MLWPVASKGEAHLRPCGDSGCEAAAWVWCVFCDVRVMVSSWGGPFGGRGQHGGLWGVGQSRLHSMVCLKLAFCAAAVGLNLYLNN